MKDLFVVYEALRRGVSVDEIHSITKIDEWFLNKLCKLIDIGKETSQERLAVRKLILKQLRS